MTCARSVLFILSIAFWARPLIRNETVAVSDLFNFRRRGKTHP